MPVKSGLPSGVRGMLKDPFPAGAALDWALPAGANAKAAETMIKLLSETYRNIFFMAFSL